MSVELVASPQPTDDLDPLIGERVSACIFTAADHRITRSDGQ